MIKLQRALSISDLMNKKYKVFEFENEWLDAFGKPERNGVWFIWANSGNGKTSFATQLCLELSKFGRVAYDSLEEGDAMTMQNAFRNSGLQHAKRRVILLRCESIEQLSIRLSAPKSPDFAIIDSFQYTRLTYAQYIAFKEKHRNKLLIFISHADGKMPAGRSAKSVMYDAALKIWVEGYRAFSKGRYIGENGGVYTIWHEGAQKYWVKTEN